MDNHVLSLHGDMVTIDEISRRDSNAYTLRDIHIFWHFVKRTVKEKFLQNEELYEDVLWLITPYLFEVTGQDWWGLRSISSALRLSKPLDIFMHTDILWRN